MRLKELRKAKGVTQEAVAFAIGCSKGNYCRYERGKREPDIATLKLLSNYFQKSIDYIVCND
jgi:transcriptional regulator with XRE-family HTH domain